jgi:hypothetical protein
MKQRSECGVIRSDEIYSKQELLRRMGISQKSWDEMLQSGLPFAQLGKSRWVSGRDLIDFFHRRSHKSTDRKPPASSSVQQGFVQ